MTAQRPYRGARTAVTAIAILVSACLASPSMAELTWLHSYTVARSQASAQHKPLLVDFAATWCGPCKQMEQTTFKSPDVVKAMARCVLVHVDVDRDRATATRYQVNGIPRIMLFDRSGRTMLDVTGYRPAAAFRDELRSALAGKKVADAGGDVASAEPAEIAALREQVDRNAYPAWSAASPTRAARARTMLVEQLGSFQAEEHDRAADLLARLSDDGIAALLAGLAHPQLAARVASHDLLTRLLDERYHIPAALQPHYDAWAPLARRNRDAHEWAAWWTRTRTLPPRTL